MNLTAKVEKAVAELQMVLGIWRGLTLRVEVVEE